MDRITTQKQTPVPLNLPNLLTWLRILLIPLFVGIFYFEKSWVSPQNQNLVATIIFTAAAITDWLDGWLARKLNQTSAFGAFLDPVADKLMVAAALIVLVELDRLHSLIALIIIGREITISALREWMAQIGQAKSVAVSVVGKVKTALQMLAISSYQNVSRLFPTLNKILEHGFELSTTAEDPRLHLRDAGAQGLGDLLIRHVLIFAQH